MKFLKSGLFVSLFALLLTFGTIFAAPANVQAAESSNTERWMDVCSDVADTLEKRDFVYSNGGTKSTLSSAIKYRKRSNCALYVSWCLQRYGALRSGQTFYIRRGSSHIHKNFSRWNSKRVNVIRVNKRASRVNLKKGDVVVWSSMGHVNIYAGTSSKSGDRLWYDAGKSSTYSHCSGSQYKNIGRKSLSYLNSKTISYIIRIKNL